MKSYTKQTILRILFVTPIFIFISILGTWALPQIIESAVESGDDSLLIEFIYSLGLLFNGFIYSLGLLFSTIAIWGWAIGVKFFNGGEKW